MASPPVAKPASSAGDDLDDDDDDFDVYETMDDSPMKIQKGLYIGSFLSEQNIAGLKDADISHVLTVAKGIPPSHPEEFQYKQVDVQDCSTEDLVLHFKDCFTFIDSGIAKGGVLVHCMAGVSRSATVCIGYLMWKEQLTYDTAFRRVHNERPWIMPNEGFRAQLLRFESQGCDLAKWGKWQGEPDLPFGRAAA